MSEVLLLESMRMDSLNTSVMYCIQSNTLQYANNMFHTVKNNSEKSDSFTEHTRTPW